MEGANGVCKAAKKLGYETSAVKSAFNEVGIDVQNCGSGQPNPNPNPPTPTPTPTPTPGVVELEINVPTPIVSGGDDQQQFVLKNVPASDAWIQTYHGYGNVDLYVAIGRPASLSDYDCSSNLLLAKTT